MSEKISLDSSEEDYEEKSIFCVYDALCIEFLHCL